MHMRMGVVPTRLMATGQYYGWRGVFSHEHADEHTAHAQPRMGVVQLTKPHPGRDARQM